MKEGVVASKFRVSTSSSRGESFSPFSNPQKGEEAEGKAFRPKIVGGLSASGWPVMVVG